MWLYARNAEKEHKNQEMLVYTSKKMSIPVARLDCTYDTKRLSGDKEQTVCYSNFDQNSYDKHTDICIGAKVAISNVNFLPEIGLYPGQLVTLLKLSTTTDQLGQTTNNITIYQTMWWSIFRTYDYQQILHHGMNYTRW